MQKIVKLLCITTAFMLGHTAAQAQNAPLKLTLFGQPSVNNDAIWMAFEKGLYQEEGLDVTYRLFPSGTTAFQAFQTGQGDIVMTGDLPSVSYFLDNPGQYQTFAAIERDSKGYVAVARKEITKPQDLVGKTIATRVGSTGSWFISEYLTKNHVDPARVTVKNLDTQLLPAALGSAGLVEYLALADRHLIAADDACQREAAADRLGFGQRESLRAPERGLGRSRRLIDLGGDGLERDFQALE